MPSKVGEKFELDDSSWEFEAGVPLAPSHQYHLLPGSSPTGAGAVSGCEGIVSYHTISLRWTFAGCGF